MRPSPAKGATPSTPADRELLAALRGVTHAPSGLTGFSRKPSAYRSTFHLEDLHLTVAGRALDVVFKDMSREAMNEEARRAKPRFLYSPIREIRTYQHVLSGSGLGTPDLYGAVSDAIEDRYWLFMERVEGGLLTESGDLDDWKAAARWLARLHTLRRSGGRGPVEGSCDWLVHDGAFYRRWMRRALDFASPGNREAVARLSRSHHTVIEGLLSQSPTFIHGEFYPSNIIIRIARGRNAVCPVDWELAALGAPLTDLAALVAGSWSDADRIQLISAYRDERERLEPGLAGEAEFFWQLTCSRIQLCVQWLGWSPNWMPPKERRHDWLREALALIDELNSL